MTLFLVVSEIRGGFLKVYAKKGQQQNPRQLRLLAYVGRPNNNNNNGHLLFVVGGLGHFVRCINYFCQVLCAERSIRVSCQINQYSVGIGLHNWQIHFSIKTTYGGPLGPRRVVLLFARSDA